MRYILNSYEVINIYKKKQNDNEITQDIVEYMKNNTKKERQRERRERDREEEEEK